MLVEDNVNENNIETEGWWVIDDESMEMMHFHRSTYIANREFTPYRQNCSSLVYYSLIDGRETFEKFVFVVK